MFNVHNLTNFNIYYYSYEKLRKLLKQKIFCLPRSSARMKIIFGWSAATTVAIIKQKIKNFIFCFKKMRSNCKK